MSKVLKLYSLMAGTPDIEHVSLLLNASKIMIVETAIIWQDVGTFGKAVYCFKTRNGRM